MRPAAARKAFMKRVNDKGAPPFDPANTMAKVGKEEVDIFLAQAKAADAPSRDVMNAIVEAFQGEAKVYAGNIRACRVPLAGSEEVRWRRTSARCTATRLATSRPSLGSVKQICAIFDT